VQQIDYEPQGIMVLSSAPSGWHQVELLWLRADPVATAREFGPDLVGCC
jgi:hypothetical protein